MLVPLSDVKAFLEITDASFDSLLNSIIQYDSDRIQTFLNRQLRSVSRTQYFQTGRRKYYLSAYPIDSIITPTVTSDDDSQTVNDDFYVWNDDGLIEFTYNTSNSEPKQLSVTYTGGYTSSVTTVGGNVTYCLYGNGGVPDTIKFATLKQVVYDFTTRRKVGMTSISMPDGSVSMMYTDGLLPDVKNMLKMYRKAATAY